MTAFLLFPSRSQPVMRSWVHCAVHTTSCCGTAQDMTAACVRTKRSVWTPKDSTPPCPPSIERQRLGALLQYHDTNDEAVEATNAEIAHRYGRDFFLLESDDSREQHPILLALQRWNYSHVWELLAGTLIIDGTKDWFATPPVDSISSIWWSEPGFAAVVEQNSTFTTSIRSQLHGLRPFAANRVEQAHTKRIFASTCAAAAAPPDTCHAVFSIRERLHVCAPHAIIAGAPKAATTSLFSYLLQHPSVSGPVNVPSQKETHWFGSPFTEAPAIDNYSHFQGYLDLFHLKPLLSLAAGDAAPMTMEASPGYLYTGSATQWLGRFLPRMKVVVMLRSPGERALSEYNSRSLEGKIVRYIRKRFDSPELPVFDNDEGVTTPSFNELATQALNALQQCPSQDLLYSINAGLTEADREPYDELGCFVNPFFAFGCYARYLRGWFRVIPRNQLWIEDVNSLRRDPAALMADLCTFLGLDPHKKFDFRYALNSGSKQGIQATISGQGAEAVEDLHTTSLSSLPRQTRCDVAAFYRPFNRDLVSLFEEQEEEEGDVRRRVRLRSFPWLSPEQQDEDCIDGR